MKQLIAIFISFLFIPILIKRKLKLSYTLLITVGVLGILSGLGIKGLGQVIVSTFTNFSTFDTILTVMMVSILGGLMGHYGTLDDIVTGILEVIHNKKNALIIIPAIVGILIMPGGALLSAPFVDGVGDEMNISKSRRAAVNLVFRHLAMFLMPYSTSILIIGAALPDLNIFKLIMLDSVFVVAVVVIGYQFFLKDIKLANSPPRKNIKANVLKLIILTSPIYIAVVLNSITGLPFFITLIASIFIVYLLSDKEDFFKMLLKSPNWNTILIVATVLVMKDVILNMDGLISLFNNIFSMSSGLSLMAFFLIAAFFFGYITGNTTAPLAIILSMLSKLNIGGWDLYIYTYFIFGVSFIGYYFSPLHLCQAFTLEHMNVSTMDLYKEYGFYAPVLLTALILSTFVFKVILHN